MASTQKYLGATTPFGIIVHIDDRVYNPTVTVEDRDGCVATYSLPFLIAHGATMVEAALSPGSGTCPGCKHERRW